AGATVRAAVRRRARASSAGGRRAVVVAFSEADRPSLAPLRYADDDGALWAEVLERLGYQTELLTVPDTDTARRASPMLARARPPTHAALREVVERIREGNRADRARGIST